MRRGIGRIEEAFGTAPQGEPLAAVRARAEHRRPAGGVRVRLRLEPVRPRRAVPAARPGGRRAAARLRRAARQLGARRRAVLPLLVLPLHVGLSTPSQVLEIWKAEFDGSYARRRLLPARRPPVLHRPPSAHRDARRADPYIKGFPDVWIADAPRGGRGVAAAAGASRGHGMRPPSPARPAEMASPPTTARRKFWGWGDEGEGPTRSRRAASRATLAERFGVDASSSRAAAPRGARAAPRRASRRPRALAAICTADPHERAGHTYGKSFRDVVRALPRATSRTRPTSSRFPRDEARRRGACSTGARDARRRRDPVRRRLERRRRRRGRDVGDGYARRGRRSTSARLDRVLEIDRASRAARIQARRARPRARGRSCARTASRCATSRSRSSSRRSAAGSRRARAATTRRSTRTSTTSSSRCAWSRRPGVVETRRLPGSGAGPAPDRLFIGSEGTLGVITEAWMRLQDRPRFRARRLGALRASGFATRRRGGARARAVGPRIPTNCRLLDARRGADLRRAATAARACSCSASSRPTTRSTRGWRARSSCCRDAGGDVPDGERATRTGDDGAREGAAGAWRNAFLGAPVPARRARRARASSARRSRPRSPGIAFEAFHAGVHASATRDAVEARLRRRASSRAASRTSTPTARRPTTPSSRPGRRGERARAVGRDQGAPRARRCSRHGGTITHHHAVGRDHRPWYDRERPELFARALRAAKAQLDPAGILNPGVLIAAP